MENDEEDEDTDEMVEHSEADNSTTSTTVSIAPAAVDEFIFTIDFRRLLVGFAPVDALMAFRVATKVWKAVVEEVINDGVACGDMLVHDGKDISYE